MDEVKKLQERQQSKNELRMQKESDFLIIVCKDLAAASAAGTRYLHCDLYSDLYGLPWQRCAELIEGILDIKKIPYMHARYADNCIFTIEDQK